MQIYSFAKTPLKVAQAPLATAMGIHGRRGGEGEGMPPRWTGGKASGIEGSVAASMVLLGGGEDCGFLLCMVSVYHLVDDGACNGKPWGQIQETNLVRLIDYALN